MNEKIIKLLEDRNFIERVKVCKNAEEFVEVMEKYQINLEGVEPETVFAEFKIGMNESEKAESNELSEMDLNAVSGGAVKGLFYWIGYGVGKLISKRTGVCV